MRPGFWFCEMCGCMYVDADPCAGSSKRDCPACGEELTPCWECMRKEIFDDTWCAKCERRDGCVRVTMKRG